MTEVRIDLGEISEETLGNIERDLRKKLDDGSYSEAERLRLEGLLRKIENFG